MKAALIPPVAHLEEYANADRLHLVLSHLLEDPRYTSFYRAQRLRGAYLILDNGAHENTSGEAMDDLLMKAWRIRANEVVLPDTLADHRATVKGAEDALAYLLGPGQDIWMQASYPAFMVVPQGATRPEWERCFQDLVTAYVKAQVARPDLFTQHLTVGVSKDYDSWPGGQYDLLDFLARFHDWMTFEVHLLGWARDLTVLPAIARDFPWVRSTDSAKPFVYAVNGIELRLKSGMGSPAYPHRSPDYFSTTLGPNQARLAARNVLAFREAAHDVR